MGQAYKLGRGVPTSFPQALDWFKRAADKGHIRAKDNYGLLLFQQGRRNEAMEIIRASADRGEPRAQYIYATALFNGDLAPRDWVRAYALMTLSARAGLAQATQSLTQMDDYIPQDQKQRGLAMATDLVTGAKAKQSADADLPPRSPAPPVPVAAAPVKAAAAPAPSITRQAGVTSPAGRWRVQIGAFSEAERAQALWKRVSTRINLHAPLQPFFVPGGGVTRLQLGPLASKADAVSLCARVKAAGTECLVKPS